MAAFRFTEDPEGFARKLEDAIKRGDAELLARALVDRDREVEDHLTRLPCAAKAFRFYPDPEEFARRLAAAIEGDAGSVEQLTAAIVDRERHLEDSVSAFSSVPQFRYYPDPEGFADELAAALRGEPSPALASIVADRDRQLEDFLGRIRCCDSPVLSNITYVGTTTTELGDRPEDEPLFVIVDSAGRYADGGSIIWQHPNDDPTTVTVEFLDGTSSVSDPLPGGASTASPTVWGGYVWVLDEDGCLHRLEDDLTWTTVSAPSAAATYGFLVVAGGRLWFTGEAPNQHLVLDAPDGTPAAAAPLPDFLGTTPQPYSGPGGVAWASGFGLDGLEFYEALYTSTNGGASWVETARLPFSFESPTRWTARTGALQEVDFDPWIGIERTMRVVRRTGSVETVHLAEGDFYGFPIGWDDYSLLISGGAGLPLLSPTFSYVSPTCTEPMWSDTDPDASHVVLLTFNDDCTELWWVVQIGREVGDITYSLWRADISA